MICPECGEEGFREWHQVLPDVRRGGRYCPDCGYGVHPPPELEAE